MSPSKIAVLERLDDAEASAFRMSSDRVVAMTRHELPGLNVVAAENSQLKDIAALRLRELAARLAGTPQSLEDDGSLDVADEVIEPISLATILALGRSPANDTLERLPPPDALIAPVSASTLPAIIAPEPQDEMPVPLRLACADPVSAEAMPRPTGESPDAATLDGDVRAPLDQHLEEVRAPEAQAVSDDHGETDIRLVDLIRRQQTLLDRLNHFPLPDEAPEREAVAALPPPSVPPPSVEQSVVERLAPPPFELAFSPRPQTAPEPAREPETSPALPPPLPPAESGDSAIEALSERSPMIIQRAQAERSGRYDPNEAHDVPSMFPAFAAGIGLALAVAGTLFFLL